MERNNNIQIAAVVKEGIKFLKAKGVTKEEVINLVDQIAEDGKIDAAEAADLKRQIKAINFNSACGVTAVIAASASLVLEILSVVGVL